MRVLFRTNAIDDRVRKTLVATLYTQPASLAMGAAAGILTSLVAASYAQRSEITNAAIALTIVALVRVAMAFVLPRLGNRDTRKLELLYEVGAFSYSLLIGIIAALTVALDAPAVVQLLMVSNAVGYATGIAARNAGRPSIAIGQMVLVFLPLCIALAMQDDLALRVLAASIMLLAPAMVSITLNVFRVLRDSISAAETNNGFSYPPLVSASESPIAFKLVPMAPTSSRLRLASSNSCRTSADPSATA